MKVDVNTIVSPLPSDALLDVVEKSLRIFFPESYRQFIKENNGVVPITNVFSHNQHQYNIERFLCILEESELDEINGWYDIEVIIMQIGESLTDNEELIGMNVVPIASLFAGDFVCLDFRIDSINPSVCVWSREESGEFEPVVYKITDSFPEFLKLLEL